MSSPLSLRELQEKMSLVELAIEDEKDIIGMAKERIGYAKHRIKIQKSRAKELKLKIEALENE